MSMSAVASLRNPAKQTRGRRIVLWLVGLFVAGQGLAGYLIDHHGLALRFPYAANVLLEADECLPPTVLWMGSSRSAGGVRPDVMNLGLWRRFGHHRVNLFNAAVPAGDPIASEFLFESLLERGHRPEVLVVEVSPDMLSRTPPFMVYHVLRQTGWSDVPAILPDTIRTGNLGRLAIARLMPLWTHRQTLRAAVLSNPKSNHPPHLDDYPEPADSPQLDHGRIDFPVEKLGQVFTNYRTDGVVSAALERLLSRCDKEGISVVIVLPAVSQNVRDCYTPEAERQFQSHLARLRETHSLEVVDLRDIVPDAGFIDMHHLGYDSGSLIYSRAALERVVLPAVERRGLAVSR